jgi:hypothetical protein
MQFFTRPLETAKTVPHANPAFELEQIEQDLRDAKSLFDLAAADRRGYQVTHPVLDAVSIIRGTGFVRVAAMKEHPDFARLCFAEATAKKRWTELLARRAEFLMRKG